MRINSPLRLHMPRFIRPVYHNQRTGKFRFWPIVLFLIFLLFYYYFNQQVVPITGRTQLVDISKEQEVALGLQSFRAVLAQSNVLNSGPEVDLVLKVAKRLVPVIDEADFEWDFKVIRSEQANAFALPGGKVAVYSGILPVTANEDGLAVVLAHEIAHAVARHGAERMTQQRLSQFAQLAVSASLSDMDYSTQRVVMGALGIGSQFGIILPFSRSHESEADYMGLIFIARACFNPEEAPLLWQRMAKHAGGGTPPQFLSTHPSPATRIEQFKTWMPEALEVRKKNCS